MGGANSLAHVQNGKPRVLIAGAGIGGLCAALALLQKGFDVDVCEQASELRELGAGLLISMNGIRVLRALGLEKAVSDIDLPATDRVVRIWNTGQSHSLYHRDPAAVADHSVYMLHRAELQRILAEGVRSLKPDAIHLGHRCIGFEDDGNKIRLDFEGRPSREADILVGADGVHSMIRQTAFGAAEGRYTGAIAWRGLVPMERLSEVHRRPFATTWVGPLAHITSYPLRKGSQQMVSFSAQVERTEWERESWSDIGSLSECLADFVGWHGEVIEMISNAELLYKWGLFVREPLPHWTAGRATLLGDACHSMVPYLGQGVVMALEDGYVLARCLEKYAGDPALALTRFDHARRDRANAAARRSSEMQPVFHHPALGAPETAIPYVEKTWSRASVKARYDWLFEYDATQAAI